jgi:hydrogenase-4 component E
MTTADTTITIMSQLNALTGGLFLLTCFGLVATRQILACLKIFIGQSVFLAASAFLLAALFSSWHLFAVAVITIAGKAFLIPWLLRKSISQDVYARREVSQVFNIPTSLLMALALAVFAFFLVRPLLGPVPSAASVNLPIGLAGLFIGAFVISARREAIPQVIGILAMENGALLAGVAIAPSLSLIAELAAAFDTLVVTLVFALLTRRIHEHVGTTMVGNLTELKED